MNSKISDDLYSSSVPEGKSVSVRLKAHYQSDFMNHHQSTISGSGDFELDDELESISCIQTLTSCKVCVLSVAFSDFYLFAGASTGDIHVLRLDLFTCEKIIQAHNGIIYSMVYNNRVGELITSSSDNTIKFWNVGPEKEFSKMGELLRWIELLPDCGDVYSLTLDCENLFFGCQDGSIQSMRLYQRNETEEGESCPECETVQITKSSKLYRFFTKDSSPTRNGGDLCTSLRCVVPAERIHSFAHNGFIFDLSILHDDCDMSLEASQSSSPLLKSCSDVRKSQDSIRASLSKQNNCINGFLVSCSGDGSVKFWKRFQDGKLELKKVIHVAEETAVFTILSRDGLLFAGLQEGCVKIFDLETCQCIRTLGTAKSQVLSLTMYHDLLVAGLANSSLMLWDSKFVPKRPIRHHNGPIQKLGSNAQYLVSASDDKSLKIWKFNAQNVELNMEKSHSNLVAKEGYRDFLTQVLGSFIRIKSVSSDESCREECRKAAKFLKSFFSKFGAESRIIPGAEGKNPIVLAKFMPSGGNEKEGGVLFYGHYDVQPARGKDWDTNPFEMTGLDGFLYGRGASDNKGPIVTFCFAVARLKQSGRLVKPIYFLIEGEEECGSIGLEEAVSSKLSFFGKIDHVLVSNSYWLDDTRPCLTFGMRGVIHVNLSISNRATEDIHSGVHGGAMREPMIDLVALLSSFTDAQDVIQIPGFYKGVETNEIPESEAAVYEDLKKHLKSSEAGPQSIQEYLRRWREPNFSIHKIESTGGGNLTVIPRVAQAHISFRIVPEQDISILKEKIRNFAYSQFDLISRSNNDKNDAKAINRLEVSFKGCAAGWISDPASRVYKVAEEAIEKVWGMSPLYIREGGSIPAIRFLEKTFSTSAIHIPLGQASDHGHLPNEKIRLLNLTNGYQVFKIWLSQLGMATLKSPISHRPVVSDSGETLKSPIFENQSISMLDSDPPLPFHLDLNE